MEIIDPGNKEWNYIVGRMELGEVIGYKTIQFKFLKLYHLRKTS